MALRKLTPEEFKQKYGDQSLSQFNVPQPPQTSYFKRVGQGLTNVATGLVSDLETQAQDIASRELEQKPGIPTLGETFKRSAYDAKSLLRGGLRTAGAAASAAFTPLLEAPGIKQATEKIGEKLAETTPIQKFNEWAGRHPEAAKDIMNTLDIAALFGGKSAAAPIGRGISTAKEVAGQGVEKVVSGATKATAKVGETTAGRLPKLLGIFSGDSDQVVRRALINPKAADLGIEGGDVAIRKAVEEGAINSVKMKNTFIRAYGTAKRNILGSYDKVAIPRTNVKGIFNDLLRRNRVKVTSEGLDFSVSKIAANPGEIGKIKTAWEALSKWDQFTLGSIDDYKQFVGKLRRFVDEAGIPSKSPFLGELYNELNNIIIKNKRIPVTIRKKYATLNKNFSAQIELYDDIVDAFNKRDPFTTLAGALGKNKDTLRRTLEFYEQKSGKSVLPIVAGRELALEKTAAFGFLNPRSWIDLLISPKTQAKVITKIGEKFPGVVKKASGAATPKTAELRLLTEAKKYKSAEEFVGTQTSIYRAGEPRAVPMSKSTFYTPDKAATAEYNLSGKSKISEVFVDESKLFRGNSSVEYAIDNGLMDKPMSTDLQKLTGFKTLREVDNAYAEGVGSNASKAYQENPNIFYTAFQQEAARSLEARGFRGARWSYEDDLTPIQYQIWDKSITRTKSQLTDIWNKAHKP